jgi:hypothetical protein
LRIGGIQALHDRGRQPGRPGDRQERPGVVAGEGLGHRRHLRQLLHAPGRRDGQRPQLAGPQLRLHDRQRVEHHVQAAGQQLAQLLRAALERHVRHLDAGAGAEHLGGQVEQRAIAG